MTAIILLICYKKIDFKFNTVFCLYKDRYPEMTLIPFPPLPKPMPEEEEGTLSDAAFEMELKKLVIPTAPPRRRGPECECAICGNTDERWNSCCNISVCFPCDFKLSGRCCVCERAELNELIDCDCCSKIVTVMTITLCPGCDEMLCCDCLEINDGCIVCCKKDDCLDDWCTESGGFNLD